MSFKSKKISSGLSVGQKLRKTRLRKKISLEKIEKITKIKKKYIQFLEADSFNKLPNLVYVKGFLKTYSRFLELNPNDILDQFKKENIIEEDSSVNIQTSIKAPKIVFSPKTLIAFLISVGIIGFILFLVFQISGFIAAPELVVYKPNSQDIQTTNRFIVFSGKTDSGSEVYINDQNIVIDAEGFFNEEVFLKEGTNSIALKSTSKAGKDTVLVYNIFAKLPKTIISQPKQEEKKINFKVRVKASCWIKMISDNNLLYEGIMVSNSEQEVVAEKEIIFSTGNAGSTEVIINNKNLGLLGEEGELKKNIKYTLTSI